MKTKLGFWTIPSMLVGEGAVVIPHTCLQSPQPSPMLHLGLLPCQPLRMGTQGWLGVVGPLHQGTSHHGMGAGGPKGGAPTASSCSAWRGMP